MFGKTVLRVWLFGSADACPGGFVLQAFECSFRFASSMPW
jgi:hypothetical protein